MSKTREAAFKSIERDLESLDGLNHKLTHYSRILSRINNQLSRRKTLSLLDKTELGKLEDILQQFDKVDLLERILAGIKIKIQSLLDNNGRN